MEAAKNIYSIEAMKLKVSEDVILGQSFGQS